MERSHVLGPLAGLGAVIILGGVALAAAMRSGDAAAPPPGPGPGGPSPVTTPAGSPHALLGQLADELGLSAEQRRAIRGVFAQAKPGFRQLRLQMQADTELLARTAPDDPAYQSVVATVGQSAAELAAQFVLQASQLRSQVHAALTPAQRARLATLEPELYAGWQARRRPDAPGAVPPDRGGGADEPL